jgi:hypothetical protein
MTDWKEELDSLLSNKGIKKTVVLSDDASKIQTLNEEDEKQIQEYLETVVKPSFQKLASVISTYQDMTAKVEIKKKADVSDLENIELRVFLMLQMKFAYRLKFVKEENHLFVIGQYSMTDLYGNHTGFEPSSMSILLNDAQSDTIINDFMNCFSTKFAPK